MDCSASCLCFLILEPSVVSIDKRTAHNGTHLGVSWTSILSRIATVVAYQRVDGKSRRTLRPVLLVVQASIVKTRRAGLKAIRAG